MDLPDMIGRYRVAGLLGSGGFATVYLAEDPTLEVTVAIKVLSESMALDPELRERFIAEARVMRRLAAPGLVTVHDINEHQGRPYFVMEHCARGTLSDRLQDLSRPLSLDEGLGLAGVLAGCMKGIHQAGMVHRDLKPSNYLIRRTPVPHGRAIGDVLHGDEELVVADFGLAKVVDLAATRVSMAGGTPGFSAPEQFRGDPTVDSRADVYALSAILINALTGAHPLPVLAGGQDPFPPEVLDRTGPLRAEVVRGLSFDRNQRHTDAAEWHAAIVAAGSGHVAGGGTSGPTPIERATIVDPTWPPPVTPSGMGPAGGSDAGTVVVGPDDTGTVVVGPDGTGTVVAPPAGAPVVGSRPAGAPVPGPPPAGRPVSPTGSGRRPALLAGLAAVVVAVVALGGAWMVGLRLPGPAIDGPRSGAVGDEAVFAIDGTATWIVDGEERTDARAISITPPEAGQVIVEARSTFRSSELTFVATDPGEPLRIDGPGSARVGEPITLIAAGSAAATYTWIVAGSETTGPSLTFEPMGAGTVTVRLLSDLGEEIERTITVIG